MANIGQKWRLAYGRGNNAHCENSLESSPRIKKMTRVVHGFSLPVLNSVWYRKMFLPILDKWKKGKPKNRSKKFHTSPIKFGYKLSDLKFWDLDPHIIPMVQKLSISYDHFKMACSADGDKLTKKLKKSKISKFSIYCWDRPWTTLVMTWLLFGQHSDHWSWVGTNLVDKQKCVNTETYRICRIDNTSRRKGSIECLIISRITGQ